MEKKKIDLRLKLKPKKTQECGAPDTQRENTQIHFSETQLHFFSFSFFLKQLLEMERQIFEGRLIGPLI